MFGVAAVLSEDKKNYMLDRKNHWFSNSENERQ